MNQVTLTEDASIIIREMIEAFGEELSNMKFTNAENDWVALMNYKQEVTRCKEENYDRSIGEKTNEQV